MLQVIAAHLGVPCTEQSYDDAFLVVGSRAHVGSDFEAVAFAKRPQIAEPPLMSRFAL